MNGRKNFMISGHTVYFPYQPYPSQFAMMEKVIRALKTNENALLESATGTGKSLALLCASLAWQEGEKERLRSASSGEKQPTKPSNFQTRFASTTDCSNNNTGQTNNSNNSINNNNNTIISGIIKSDATGDTPQHTTQTGISSSTRSSTPQTPPQVSTQSISQPQQSLITSSSPSDPSQATLQNDGSQSTDNHQEVDEFGLNDSIIDIEEHDNSFIIDEFDKFQTLFQEDEIPILSSSASPLSRTRKRFIQETNDHSLPTSDSHIFNSQSSQGSQISQLSQPTQPTQPSQHSPSQPSHPSHPSQPSRSQSSQSSHSPPNQILQPSQSIQPSHTTTQSSQLLTTDKPAQTNPSPLPPSILIDLEDDKENKPINNNNNNNIETKAKPKKKLVTITYDDDDDFMPTPKFTKPTLTPAKRKATKKNEPKTPTSNKTAKKTPPTTPPNSTATSVSPSSTALLFPSPPHPRVSSPPLESPPPSQYVKVPTIFFGTRTHTQVAQIVSELERTSYLSFLLFCFFFSFLFLLFFNLKNLIYHRYRPVMSVLAARDHYCIHSMVSRMPNKNPEW